MRVIVTGGGTGGHIYPALAIADKICGEFANAEILYIGTPNSLEEKIVKKHGYRFQSVPVKGFLRKINMENLKRVFLAGQAVSKSKKIIREFKPDVVIGTGGYVAGPVVFAASQGKVLTMIHEQNAYPGITNKLLSKRVDKIYLGFEAAREKFKTSAPIQTIGNPVRKEIFEAKTRERARADLGMNQNEKFLLISGGSSGSQTINEVVTDLIPRFIDQNIGFVFSTGLGYYEGIYGATKHLLKDGKFMVVDYIDNMADYISASNLCIISAGATTIAEVNAAGRASIIIPKAYSAENHQEVNAKNIEENGAGSYIREMDLTAENLLQQIVAMLRDEQGLQIMEEKSKGLYGKDPCEEIIQDIKNQLKLKEN